MCSFNGYTTCSGVLQISNMSVGIGSALGGQIPEDRDGIHEATLFSTGTCRQRWQINACHSGSRWGALSILQCGSHQKGGPALSRGFWGSPGARPHLQSAQRTPAECNVCFASSRLCRILLFHFQEHRGENHPMALEKPVLLVSVLEL